MKTQTFACEECGEVVTMPLLNYRKRRFCSASCSGAANHRKRKTSMHGPDNPRYNGGFSKSENRTVVCTRDGGFVFWYRIVLEDAIGRPLTPDEIVHHINGDPTDDRLENLQIVQRGEHMEMHREEIGAAYQTTLDARAGLPHRWDIDKYRGAA